MSGKINKGLLLLMVTILSFMPLVISFGIVFCFMMLIYDINMTVEVMFHPMILGTMLIYLAWRIHKNYNRLKEIIIDDTDRFNEVLRKYYRDKMNDRYGR